MEKIHNMITKCVEVLDSTVKVKFCPITAGLADIKEREILLPDWDQDVCHLLMTALHELAHLWYSTLVSPEDLNREEQEALGWVDDAYADYRFCKDHPEFRIAFIKKHIDYQEEFKAGGAIGDLEFWHDLSYAVWDVGASHGLKTSLCRELWKAGLILELQEAIASAKSTSDLIPAVRKLALQLQAIAKSYPFSGGFERAEKEIQNLEK